MADNNTYSSVDNSAEKDAATSGNAVGGVNITDVFAIAMRFWYWVVISVIVCTGLAILNVKRTVPIYTRTCSVIIRDDAQSAVGSSSVDFSDIGIGMSNTVLQDEMASLKSPDLMEQVVKKLKLTVSYASPGTFHNNVLYGSNLPVNVDFPDMPSDETASLTLHINEAGHLSVEDVIINGKLLIVPSADDLTWGSVIGTSSGRVIITKTPFFREGTPMTILVKRLTLTAATNMYEGEIAIEQVNKKSNVVQITCNDASQQRGDEILTSLINAYNQDWIKGRAEVVAVTSNFITDRLNIIESELGHVDSDISSFKSSNLIPDLNQTSSMYMQQSNTASNQIMTLSNQLQMARYLKNFIMTEGRNNTVLPVNTVIGAGIEQQIGEYNSIMMQRNSYMGNTSASNPVIVELDSRLAAIRSSILASLDNEIHALSGNIASLERSEQTANARVAANPRQAQVLLSAERQQKVKETLYLYLLQKREENELSQAFTSVNTRILRRPTGPATPTFPKAQQTYMIGFLVGLILPFAIIYIVETLNTKIRGRKDVEGLNIPIVGEIPIFRHETRKFLHFYRDPSKLRDELPAEEDIVVAEGSRDIINEAFRVLRTNVSFITADSIPCVSMMTSFNPGSGKTFISLNLGIALALKGKKVLLVDGDLRRGSLSRIVHSPKKGLAEYLNGSQRDVDQLIVHDTITPGLSILPTGAFPPNPTELLESSRFDNLVQYFRTEYDYIFIDCPPVQMMADAQIIDKVCDRTFFVLRVGLFERSMLAELDKLHRTKAFRNMSVIINASETAARYGTSYRYGYGYSRKNYKDYRGYRGYTSYGPAKKKDK
ncbi:MAG: polysaccharide biosynthesis tyrosine autokinase [Bacteroides sp.]|nr:polysaccharide biosynthesis tyrosine autokinase [Bacteroides sp.]